MPDIFLNLWTGHKPGRCYLITSMTSLMIGLSGCGIVSKITGSEGEVPEDQAYQTEVIANDNEREISVLVVSRGDGLDLVRETVRFETAKYCLVNFGSSSTAWVIDPVTGDWAFAKDGQKLTFKAKCTAG